MIVFILALEVAVSTRDLSNAHYALRLPNARAVPARGEPIDGHDSWSRLC
jgi:hypothetical protein